MSPTDAAAPDYLEGRDFRELLRRHVAVPLGFGFATVFFFVAIIYYLQELGRWVDASTEMMNAGHRMLHLVIDQETALRGYVIAGREEFLDPFRDAESRIKPQLAEMRAMAGDNRRQLQRLALAERSYREWRDWALTVIERRRVGDELEGYIGTGGGKRLIDRIRILSDAIITEAEHERQQRSRRATTTVLVISGSYLALSLLFSALMAYWGRRQLRELAGTYSRLIQGQGEHNRTLRQQAWLRDGLSRMAEELVGRDSVAATGEAVLAFFARQLDVAVGAIYASGEREMLDRVASYGFSRDMAGRDQRFAPGEGLVGQVAVEKRTLQLQPLEASYFKVSSGLGQGQPAELLVVPLCSEQQLVGVMEIGFVRALEPRDHEFVAMASDTIGAALNSALYRARLKASLASVQALNDELQAQHEELQVANSELEEQSQALEEAKDRLETQQVELEHANDLLEEQNDLVREKNAALERSQQQLQEHALELERASRYKSEFLANMSHELRTPLNSSLILSKLLADNGPGNLNPEQVKFAQSIHAAGSELLLLINDVLDIAKVEAGKLEVVANQMTLSVLLDGVMASFRPAAEDKGLSLACARADNLPTSLNTDKHRLEQILRNLMANAIKFTEAGGVTLRVEPVGSERIRFVVTDTGPGIPDTEKTRIFDPFYQIDSSTSRRYGGTGLGLSISRQLAALLGGHIDVFSEAGQGSTFVLDIPIALASDPYPPQRPEALMPARDTARARSVAEPAIIDDRDRLEAERKTLLVIEDERAFAQILYDLAREQGYQCLVAGSAEEGFELALQHVPHAVLLDMKLPDHSGMTVLASLKEESSTRHIPVHIISVEDRQAPAMTMGAVGYLIKPVTREQLSEMLQGIERRIAQKMKRVLVVEAPDGRTDSTRSLIADRDVEVIFAATGGDALELLKQRVFDCLIVDLDLADMSGEKLLSEMAAQESIAFPPVIVHASRNLTAEEEQRLMRWSRSIIVKSARSPERLLDEVTLFLHKVESELSAERRDMLRLARSRDRALEGRKILVVDDDVRNIFAISSALESRGALVEIGRNGLDAIARLQEMPDIDLVLMDIMMPEMDGYDAIAAIRLDQRFARLPIIAVTARAMRDDQERCLRAGANDYVAKPVDLDRLVSLVRVWMPHRGRF